MCNPIRDYFASLEKNPVTGRLAEFDWKQAGVDAGCVMFITGRCGSTWLGHILEELGMPNPREYFNDTSIPHYNKEFGARNIRDYISAIGKKYKLNQYFDFQIDPMRFFWLDEIVDTAKIFVEGPFKFVFMARRDIVAQAYSYAHAKKSGVWHRYQPTSQRGLSEEYISSDEQPEIVIEDHALRTEIEHILRSERRIIEYMTAHGIVPLFFTYEDLLADRFRVVDELLRFLGRDRGDLGSRLATAGSATERLNRRGNKYEIIAGFSARNRDYLEDVQNGRRLWATPFLPIKALHSGAEAKV